MQFAKDSFYMALRERLASLNPQRTVTLNGATRPAVVVAENELVIPVEPLPDAFYIEWGAAQAVETGTRTLIAMDCMISHHTFGTVESGKCDFTQTPSVDLGTNVFWTAPQFDSVTGSNGPRREALPGKTQSVRLERRALLKVFFFSEVNAL